MTNITGTIHVNVQEWSDDLVIEADAYDIKKIMKENMITLDELMEEFDPDTSVTLTNVHDYIASGINYEALQTICNWCFVQMKSDYLGMAGRLKKLEDEV
jgi:hypothetical protein